MASNGRGNMRPQHGNKTPPFVLVGLLVVCAILTFNYWNASSKNNMLAKELSQMEEKLQLLSMKKGAADKRIETLTDKVKQEDAEAQRQRSMLTDREGELNKRENEIDSLKMELNKGEEAVITCKQDLDYCKDEVQRLEGVVNDTKAESINTNKKCNADMEAAKEGYKKSCQADVDSERINLLLLVQKLIGSQGLLQLQAYGANLEGMTIEQNIAGEMTCSKPSAEQPSPIQDVNSRLKTGQSDNSVLLPQGQNVLGPQHILNMPTQNSQSQYIRNDASPNAQVDKDNMSNNIDNAPPGRFDDNPNLPAGGALGDPQIQADTNNTKLQNTDMMINDSKTSQLQTPEESNQIGKDGLKIDPREGILYTTTKRIEDQPADLNPDKRMEEDHQTLLQAPPGQNEFPIEKTGMDDNDNLAPIGQNSQNGDSLLEQRILAEKLDADNKDETLKFGKEKEKDVNGASELDAEDDAIDHMHQNMDGNEKEQISI